MHPHSLSLSGAERPRLVPDRVRDAEPAKATHQAGPSQLPYVGCGEAQLLARGGGQLGYPARVTEHVRRLQVDEVRDPEERGVELVVRQRPAERGLGTDDRVPRIGAARGLPRIPPGSAASRSAMSGSNWAPWRLRASATAASSPPIRCATSTYSAIWASRAASGISAAAQLAGPASPSQRSYEAPIAGLHLGGQSDLGRQRPGELGVPGDHPVHLAEPGQGESEADLESVQRGMAVADAPQGG